MRFPVFAAIAILFPLATCAQTPPTTPAKATVSGSVIDADSNQPLRKATVTVTAAGPNDQEARSLTVITGADGAFSIPDIEPGRYRLSVERSGYLLDRKARKLRVLSLAAGQTIRELQLPMVAGGIVIGRVLDKDGDPLSRATVQVIQKGRRALAEGGYIGPAETNDMGEYRIFQVPPGSYYVAAAVARDQDSPVEGSTKPSPKVGYVPMYYPGTSDFAQAAAFEVKSGSEVRADFTMAPAPVFDVRGKVVPAPGARADHTEVVVHPNGNLGLSSSQSASVKQDGTFEVTGVPPGSYVAIAIAMNIGSQKARMAQARFEIADANVEGLVLNLSTVGAKVRGRILVEGKPAFDISQLSIFMQPAGDDAWLPRYASFDGTASGIANVNRDGTFVVENVMPGSYFPEVFSHDTAARDYYVKTVRQGTKDVSDGELVIGEASSAQPLEILAGSGGQTVDGVVQDSASKPAAGALVVALPDVKRRKRLGSYDRSMTDQQGRFALRGLQPGEYTLIALDEDEGEVAFDPEFLAQFESKGVAFHARENGRDTVTLKLVTVDNP